MQARFKDETITWFRTGEDPEQLQALHDLTSPYPKPSRLSEVMVVVASMTLAASCFLYVVRHLP